MISSSMLVVIGHVREVRHMYWYAVPTSEHFRKLVLRNYCGRCGLGLFGSW